MEEKELTAAETQALVNELTADEQHQQNINARIARETARRANLHGMTDDEKISAVRSRQYARSEINHACQGKKLLRPTGADPIHVSISQRYAPLLSAMRQLAERGFYGLLSLSPIAQTWQRNAPACDAPGAGYLVHFEGFSVIASIALGIDADSAQRGLKRAFCADPAKAIHDIYRQTQFAQLLTWRRNNLLLREVEIFVSLMSFRSHIETSPEARDIANGWAQRLGITAPFDVSGGVQATAEPTKINLLGEVAAAIAAEEQATETETEDNDYSGYGSGAPGI